MTKAGAAPGEAPLQQVNTLMQGDTAVFTVGTNATRVATKPGAIPAINNGFAIDELFLRRARATQGTGDYWLLALAGGVTVPVTVRPIGVDSLDFFVAGQSQHYQVDAARRIPVIRN